MIEINLVPQNLRKKKKSQLISSGIKLPHEIIFGLGGGLLTLLIIVHIVLLYMNISKIAQYKGLQKKWEAMNPDKQNVDRVIKELRSMQKNLQSIEEITSKRQILWAQKLNLLSDLLAKGIWFRKISLTEEMLFIEGSAISKETTEMINVHNFANTLKSNKTFLDGFSDIELGSIQRRKIQTVEIADFTITTKLKE